MQHNLLPHFFQDKIPAFLDQNMKKNKSYPLISIALCTYNGESYLTQQIDSLVAQTYPNLEIIISDDASTDHTVSILKSYNETHISIFINKQNMGYNKNFEACLRRCTGKYLCIADQDDIWDKDKIQKLYEKVRHFAMIFSNSALIDEEGKALNMTMSQTLNRTFSSIQSPLELVYANVVSGHAMLFDRQLLDKALPVPDGIFYDWWLAYVATTMGGIQYLDETLVNHREHEGSAMLQHAKENPFKHKKHQKLTKHRELLARIKLFNEVDNLSREDRLLLTNLQALLQTKQTKLFSWRLLLFFIKHGELLFIKYRKRPLLNRLNYYFKEAKRINYRI